MSEMKKYRHGFVILHYCALDMTKESIASVREKMAGRDYKIVVVDNASPNNTGKDLAELYGNDEDIKVILSEKNLGFANGNNLGFKAAKDEFNCDFICVMNNDVLLTQDDFSERIEAEYEKSGFGLLGPHVTLKGGHENAMYYEIKSIPELEKEIRVHKNRLKHLKSKLYPVLDLYDRAKLKFRIFLGKIHVMPEFVLHEDNVEGCFDRHENIVLHGCCLIYSREYMKYYEDAFDPATFMFREEEILHVRCKKKNILMVYEPGIDILHMEDVATNLVYKTEKNKEIFNLENQIDSLGILIERLK